MLNQTTVEKINRQIQDELRTVDSICSDQQEKLEAIERIAKLKELLDPQPTRSQILDELADAIRTRQTQSPTPHPTSILSMLADHLRSR